MSADRVVVDASVAVKWLVAEVDSGAAIELGNEWAEEGVALAAPHLLPFEVANALHRRVLIEELAIDRVGALMEFLFDMGIELFAGAPLHVRAFALASEFNQRAAYDAHYLALAEELDCEFWTADARFYRAAAPAVERIRLLGAAAS